MMNQQITKDMDENNALLNLQNDIKNYPQKIKKNKKFGISLNPSSDILKRRLYSKLTQLAKLKTLSKESLEWMGDFANNGPYEDIRQFFQNHDWVEQFRDMKKVK